MPTAIKCCDGFVVDKIFWPMPLFRFDTMATDKPLKIEKGMYTTWNDLSMFPHPYPNLSVAMLARHSRSRSGVHKFLSLCSLFLLICFMQCTISLSIFVDFDYIWGYSKSINEWINSSLKKQVMDNSQSPMSVQARLHCSVNTIRFSLISRILFSLILLLFFSLNQIYCIFARRHTLHTLLLHAKHALLLHTKLFSRVHFHAFQFDQKWNLNFILPKMYRLKQTQIRASLLI